MEAQFKESTSKLEVKKQKCRNLKQVLKELEFENDDLNREKIVHLKETDMGAAQIHSEML